MEFIKKHIFSTAVFGAFFIFAMFIDVSQGGKSSLIVSLLTAIVMGLMFSIPVFIIEFIVNKVKSKRKPSSIDNDVLTSTVDNKNTLPKETPQVVATQKIIKTVNSDVETLNSFIAIDFETATAKSNSACSIGIVKVQNEKIILKEHYFIQPPENRYDKGNTSVNGISAEDTKDCDTFPAVWEKIKGCFNNTYVVAHNAPFDMGVLKATLNFYNIPLPSFNYFDSMVAGARYANKEELASRKLNDMCDYYEICLDNHHNAECDAEACATIVLCAIKNSRYKTFSSFIKGRDFVKDFSDAKAPSETKFKRNYGNKINVTEVEEKITEEEKVIDEDFNGKVFVFTGELDDMSREEAYEKVILGGGSVKNAVSKKVDILVNADTVITSKVKRALELQEEGHHIQIITGEQFMEMLESTVAINI